MRVCLGFGTDTKVRTGCENAHGLRAGARSAVLGGLRAERTAIVATKERLDLAPLTVETPFQRLRRVHAELTGQKNLTRYVDQLTARWAATERPKLTLIRGGRDDG